VPKLRAALNISYASVLWSVVAGSLSIAVGLGSSSTALVGTGTDLIADLVSSVVLVWRFRVELHGGRAGHEVERRAHLVAALALITVAVGIAAASITRLISAEGASPDAASVAVAAASVVVLPLLAIGKRRIAQGIPSPALRTDSVITFVGAATAGLSLVGLVLTESFGWTAADPAAALGIALLAGYAGIDELRDR
jgi:divalent metal cation (Fe/Co/Zn/Cd) transporter